MDCLKRKLGIIGGMGSHAAVWFFKRIIELSNGETDQDHLEILLHNNSRVPDRTKAIVYNETSPLPELKRSVESLKAGQVDVIVMACMTAYSYYHELKEIFDGPIIHPADVLVEELKTNTKYTDVSKVGILGTTGLIKARVYHEILQENGYEVIDLSEMDHEEYFMKPIYMQGGVKSGNVDQYLRDHFFKQFPILMSKGVELVIGACTEVPLLIDDHIPISYVDSIDLLCRRTVSYCYFQESIYES